MVNVDLRDIRAVFKSMTSQILSSDLQNSEIPLSRGSVLAPILKDKSSQGVAIGVMGNENIKMILGPLNKA